ncbi:MULTISPECIES: hypothetical protein [Azospirillaceae]|jgi:hypothetical protein|uniref:Uncharacterized protein n=1 Tax=Rhodocista pekingensis TaxID=201185 RepID=A0ABW2KVN0_9PROT|nr:MULTISPECIES: hypothetical protein [Azospirillaceae]SNT20382.1 hypothetical protein SAMN05880556_13411 [Azospirillum sp. RU38E]SNT32196.1 hypothetical protein SAMN05880591_13411 [Azospirillum sp. RU37A]
MRYLIERLRERSTWLGLTTLLTALGASIDPGCLDHIATAGAAAAGLILALMPDRPRR